MPGSARGFFVMLCKTPGIFCDALQDAARYGKGHSGQDGDQDPGQAEIEQDQIFPLRSRSGDRAKQLGRGKGNISRRHADEKNEEQ